MNKQSIAMVCPNRNMKVTDQTNRGGETASKGNASQIRNNSIKSIFRTLDISILTTFFIININAVRPSRQSRPSVHPSNNFYLIKRAGSYTFMRLSVVAGGCRFDTFESRLRYHYLWFKVTLYLCTF